MGFKKRQMGKMMHPVPCRPAAHPSSSAPEVPRLANSSRDLGLGGGGFSVWCGKYLAQQSVKHQW